MTMYLSSPQSQMQAHAVRGMPVLVSFAKYGKWMESYLPSYGRLLIDSGAYSELTGKAKIDLPAYTAFAQARPWADAWAGLDDISGDWRRSLKNYQAGGFPTMHESDPPELLDELIPMARERGKWIGVGLLPPRHGKERIVRGIVERIPDDLHVHGWALRGYAHIARLDSFDSTNWMLDAFQILNAFPWLTPAEAHDLIVLRYRRAGRVVRADETLSLFNSEDVA